MQGNRLFQIIYLLLERGEMTASQLAERFEVSTRTIYRDVEALSQAGIPIYSTKGRGGGLGLLPGRYGQPRDPLPAGEFVWGQCRQLD